MNRLCISFFGCTNAGKSSLVNALTAQQVSVVSEIAGTTTDPVFKMMEFLPLGPVAVYDTPGIDDESVLGKKRVERTWEILLKTDIAVFVTEHDEINLTERKFLDQILNLGIPYVLAKNKCAELDAVSGVGIESLKEKIIAEYKKSIAQKNKKPLLNDLLKAEEIAVLVTPIDESAPKDRMILPQVQSIRDVLEADASCVVTKETELKKVLSALKDKPSLVVTDSQAFEEVSKIVPLDVRLTSFSILMARFKGYLKPSLAGIEKIKNLKNNDRILIAEGCSHHRQCGDIGSVKIPKWLKEMTGKNFAIDFASGESFPKNLDGYSLVIHCGGCMLSERQVMHRLKFSQSCNVPFVNYGVLIAYRFGILERASSFLV